MINLWCYFCSFGLFKRRNSETHKISNGQIVKTTNITTNERVITSQKDAVSTWIGSYFSNLFASLYQLISFVCDLCFVLSSSLFYHANWHWHFSSFVCVLFSLFRLVASFAFECFEFAHLSNRPKVKSSCYSSFSRIKRWIDDSGNN